jgi:Ankyrin repeats (3 copies)/Ankyrin repeats (many copies)
MNNRISETTLGYLFLLLLTVSISACATQNLILAAAGGDLQRVKNLLEKGANVNEKDTDGRTPLLLATAKGHYLVVKFLLDNGANVNARFSNPPFTALVIAIKQGHRDIAELLLDRGADINDRVLGLTPLMTAALFRQQDIVKLLLAKGADVHATIANGATAIDAAKHNHHTEIAELLESARGTKTSAQQNLVQQSSINKSSDEANKKDTASSASSASDCPPMRFEPGTGETDPVICKDVKADSITNMSPAPASGQQKGAPPSNSIVAKPRAVVDDKPSTAENRMENATRSSSTNGIAGASISNANELDPNISGFITALDLSMSICHVNERMAAMSGMDKIIKDAQSCAEESRRNRAKDYTNILKEVQNKKPSTVPKFKDLFTSWWGIMGSMPRISLTKWALQQEQEKDKRIFQEKRAAFETEFLF